MAVINFFELESVIIARLKSETGVTHIYGESDLVHIDEQQQRTPAIYVLYRPGGGVRGEDGKSEQRDLSVFSQEWTISPTIRHVAPEQGGTSLREEAGTLIVSTYQALAGWRPAQGYTTLELIQPPSPNYSDVGFGYFPMVFQTNGVLV